MHVTLPADYDMGVIRDRVRWEVVHFSLWEHDTPKADGDVFEVLHLSAPGRDRLPLGRRW